MATTDPNATRVPSQNNSQEGTHDLAEMISAVMRHPEAPTELYNHLGDWIISYGNPKVDEPDRIRRALAEFDEPEEAATRTAAESNEQSPYARHAGLVADLLESEDAPESLRSLLDHFTMELSNQLAEGGECCCSPETVRRNLPTLFERAAKAGLVCVPGGVMLERKGVE